MEILLLVVLAVWLVTMLAWSRDRKHIRQLVARSQEVQTPVQVVVSDASISPDGTLLTAISTDAENQADVSPKESRINELEQEIQHFRLESVQSKALFSTISSVAYDLVFVLDEERTIITLNKSADTLFGVRNPVGEKLTDVLEAPDLDDIVVRALSEEESLEEQLVIDQRYYRVRTQVMRYEGLHVFIGVALQDITQLVRLNRARRDMVANISHELRTPITRIRLIIDGLFHDADKPKRKASIASLKDIARETDSLEHLVQELLDLSMIESGQAILKLVDVPLAEVVHEVATRLEDQLAHKDLQIVRNVGANVRVLCDREQTQRVLINLIHNAIKWSPRGETITINADADEEDVTIAVLDKGPGVPDDQRDRIFERFYQIDPARSGGDGTGLGLAICKHIVEAHGGRIWAEAPTAESGGRFLFTLLNASDMDMVTELSEDMPSSLKLSPNNSEEFNNHSWTSDPSA